MQGSDGSLSTFARPFTCSTTVSESRNTGCVGFATVGELEPFDESPILRNGVDGGSDRFGDLFN